MNGALLALLLGTKDAMNVTSRGMTTSRLGELPASPSLSRFADRAGLSSGCKLPLSASVRRKDAACFVAAVSVSKKLKWARPNGDSEVLLY